MTINEKAGNPTYPYDWNKNLDTHCLYQTSVFPVRARAALDIDRIYAHMRETGLLEPLQWRQGKVHKN